MKYVPATQSPCIWFSGRSTAKGNNRKNNKVHGGCKHAYLVHYGISGTHTGLPAMQGGCWYMWGIWLLKWLVIMKMIQMKHTTERNSVFSIPGFLKTNSLGCGFQFSKGKPWMPFLIQTCKSFGNSGIIHNYLVFPITGEKKLERTFTEDLCSSLQLPLRSGSCSIQVFFF